jgi:hypothetical protein
MLATFSTFDFSSATLPTSRDIPSCDGGGAVIPSISE